MKIGVKLIEQEQLERMMMQKTMERTKRMGRQRFILILEKKRKRNKKQECKKNI